MSITPNTYAEFEQWWADYQWFTYRKPPPEYWMRAYKQGFLQQWMRNALWGRSQVHLVLPTGDTLTPAELHVLVKESKDWYARFHSKDACETEAQAPEAANEAHPQCQAH